MKPLKLMDDVKQKKNKRVKRSLNNNLTSAWAKKQRKITTGFYTEVDLTYLKPMTDKMIPNVCVSPQYYYCLKPYEILMVYIVPI